MKKVNLEIKLITNDENINYKVSGYLNERQNEIIYIEPTELKTKVKYNFKNKILVRENKDYKIEIKFNENCNTKGIIYINDLNKTIELDINTIKFEEIERNVNIEYYIEKEKFYYSMKVEV